MRVSCGGDGPPGDPGPVPVGPVATKEPTDKGGGTGWSFGTHGESDGDFHAPIVPKAKKARTDHGVDTRLRLCRRLPRERGVTIEGPQTGQVDPRLPPTKGIIDGDHLGIPSGAPNPLHVLG